MLKNFFTKPQKKKPIIFKVFRTKGFRLQDLKQTSNLRTNFARQEHLMAFDAKKIYNESLWLSFIVAKSLKKFSLKFPLCIPNLERLIQASLSFFWSVSVCRVPFSQPADSVPARLNH